MEVYIADAFTNCPFSGNQAGVVLLGQADFPRDTLMRALAGELKHSETAFVRRTGERSFHVRFFTPVDEVDLCGHAAVAAFPAPHINSRSVCKHSIFLSEPSRPSYTFPAQPFRA